MYTAPVGSAVPTSAGELKNTRMVIQAVSVDMDEKGLVCDSRVVSQATEGVLKIADKAGVSSVAFPAIGTGLYGLPTKDSVRSIYGTAIDFFKAYPTSPIKRVSIVLYSQEAFNEAQEAVDQTIFEGEVKEVKETGEESLVDKISKVSSLEEIQNVLPRDLTEKLGEGENGTDKTIEMLSSLTSFAPEPATFGRDAFNNIVAVNSETGKPLPSEEQQKMLDVALEAGFIQKVEGEKDRYSVRKGLQDAVKKAIGEE
ncbi:MAG: macro domain-containing protein [Patescibacteria group bacterium]